MSSSDDKGSGDLERHGSGHLFDSLGAITDNDDDPNFDPTAIIMEDESPYPEVRSAVSNTDDPTMPVSTLRAWVLGIIWTAFIPGINQFFYFRYPYVVIEGFIPLFVSFPIGKLWARYIPNVTLFGVELNPGPFTIKEHVMITAMSLVAGEAAYATDIIAVQKVFYNQSPSFAYQWLLVMSTQLIGYSIGGISKRIIVDPSSMIWPENLVFGALFNTIHSLESSGSRGSVVSHVSASSPTSLSDISFTVNFLPSYLFTALSSFSWVCWIAPNNVKLNQMFGVTHGLAMGVLTFDWGQIAAFTGSPLPTPWWAAANNGIAVVFFSWFLVPILYYTNTWYSAFLPVVSSQTFDNTGIPYNVSRILKDDATFDLDAYKAYSAVFISVSFAIFYCLSFATITSTITHTLIYNRKWIWNRARRQPDIHARLMSVYKEVPDWWYLTIFCTMFGFGVAAIEIWHADLPVWAFILALIIGFASTIPIGIITAMTNQEIGLNVITELIIGYLLPGRPIAMMMFKAWGYITMSQALNLAAAFKLGHYMKIPPRPMFFCQVVATVISGTVQLGVQAWLFSNVEDICSPSQKDGFSCPNTNVFGNASIIVRYIFPYIPVPIPTSPSQWGVIGPQRIFAHGQLYYGLLFFFLIGAVLPIIQWALHKRLKIGLLNVLSAALDTGYAIGVVFIFFTLQYPDNGNIGLNSIQNWWGNTVFLNTADAKGRLKRDPGADTKFPSAYKWLIISACGHLSLTISREPGPDLFFLVSAQSLQCLLRDDVKIVSGPRARLSLLA
ncbi:OPT oligopeptide transporter protein-domain-containing protein [Lactarius quietus]|nr:OPT oligopeptide transporter protein-domain-containing protein [Lactarius quietus]